MIIVFCAVCLTFPISHIPQLCSFLQRIMSMNHTCIEYLASLSDEQFIAVFQEACFKRKEMSAQNLPVPSAGNANQDQCADSDMERPYQEAETPLAPIVDVCDDKQPVNVESRIIVLHTVLDYKATSQTMSFMNRAIAPSHADFFAWMSKMTPSLLAPGVYIKDAGCFVSCKGAAILSVHPTTTQCILAVVGCGSVQMITTNDQHIPVQLPSLQCCHVFFVHNNGTPIKMYRSKNVYGAVGGKLHVMYIALATV